MCVCICSAVCFDGAFCKINVMTLFAYYFTTGNWSWWSFSQKYVDLGSIVTIWKLNCFHGLNHVISNIFSRKKTTDHLNGICNFSSAHPWQYRSPCFYIYEYLAIIKWYGILFGRANAIWWQKRCHLKAILLCIKSQALKPGIRFNWAMGIFLIC